MITKIKFNNGTKDKSLVVESIFSYTYNAVKTVLKLQVLEKNHTFEEIAELRKCTGKIKVYNIDDETKEEVLVGEYTGYGLGDKGFTSNFTASTGTFDIELTQESSYEVRLASLEATMEEVLMMIMEA